MKALTLVSIILAIKNSRILIKNMIRSDRKVWKTTLVEGKLCRADNSVRTENKG